VGIAYLILSSMAFLIVFGLSLRETLRLARGLKKADGESLPPPRDTKKTTAVKVTQLKHPKK